MSALLEALRQCQALAPRVVDQIDHQLAANRHDAQEYEPTRRMVAYSDFDRQVLARERYYAEKYGDQR